MRYYETYHKNITLMILLNMCTTYKVQRRKNEDRAKIIMVKEITTMRQRSIEQRSTVDSRRHLTKFKMLVSQSMSAVLKDCLTTVKC